MFGLQIGFERPWYLLLLALLPLLWVFSFRSLSALGPVRRLLALLLRSLALVALVLALAEIQLERTSQKLTVLYLLDQSESIPRPQRWVMMDYVIQEVRRHRRRQREDRAGVIVFGADARIEIPPFDDDLPSIGRIESALELRRDATNIAAALKLAQAAFPEDAARRVVLVTDGNENLGDARQVARMLADDGVGIDVVPIQVTARAEVEVEKIALPADLRKGQTFQARVVINNYASPDAPDGAVVPGKLTLTQHLGRQERLISEQHVELKPGKNVFSFQHEIDQSALFTYRATFTPDDPTQDLIPQNNQTSAYTHVRGQGRVLLIEDAKHPGEFDLLVSRLRQQNMEVTVRKSNELFTSPVELLQYDTVVLANVPRSSGDPETGVTAFSDAQIQMLVRNTHEMGCGLVMLGGPRSFGAGGWANTELEKAMPVDFQIRNAKIRAVGALVMMMHASEMAQGNHWQKVVAREALKALGPMDYCGLLHWDNLRGRDDWLWGKPQGLIRVGDQRRQMLARLDRMAPGDMPEFEPAMKRALAAFQKVNAAVKHMIVISDGDPSPPSGGIVQAFKDNGIQITTVAIGAHGPAGHRVLRKIAMATGGKYYVVNNPRALPRIYQREVRRISRPLVYEPEEGVRPIVTFPHEMLGHLDPAALQPLRGYVLTTIKDNPLVEQSIVADKPDPSGRNSTLLASWNYGLGRAVAFTTDAGYRWADRWAAAAYYDRFFADMIRWSMRPIQNNANFTVAADVKDGQVRLVVTALDPEDQFLNFLNLTTQVLGPDLEPFDVQMQQVAPGRYVGQFAAKQAGSYLYNIMPGARYGMIRGGVNVPYSSEFRDRQANEGLLAALAALQPRGGRPGKIIRGRMDPDGLPRQLPVDTFRHNLAKAVSTQGIWPLAVVCCAVVFFADVVVRRVAIDLAWFRPALAWLAARLLRRRPEAAPDERLERLRSRKAALSQQIEQRRATARFEPEPEQIAAAEGQSPDELLQAPASAGEPRRPAPARAELAPEREEEDSYTARLLKAKREALSDRRKRQS